MNPRIRRLQSDYRLVMETFSNHPRIKILGVTGNPPEKYMIEMNVLSLVPGEDEEFSQGNKHTVEISLSLDYPRRPPFCRMLSPVFHPNIDPQKICIGDHWSAGQDLRVIILRIAEMLAYQSFNIKSPLNGKAAAWAEQNEHMLPLEKIDFQENFQH